MNKKIIIAACLLVVLIAAFGVKTIVTEARTIHCPSWGALKTCFDDNPDNDHACCDDDHSPKDEMAFPH